MSNNPILTTRFNNATFENNCRYREINSDIGCIYGSPLLLNDKIQLDSLCFIIEMNNEENRIEGVGLIRNRTHSERQSELYSCHNYNRYVYKGKYRLDASIIERHNVELLNLFNTILFKGKSHMKRSSGISKITSKLYKKEICLDFCKNMLLMNPALRADFDLVEVDDNTVNAEIVEKMIKKEISRIFKLLKNENIK
jgi:hypothetical protein